MRCCNWQNKATAVWLSLLLVVAISMAWLWWHNAIQIQSNIFKLLPAMSSNPTLLANDAKINARLNQQVFVMLEADSEQALEQGTQHLTQAIRRASLWQPLQNQQAMAQLSQHVFDYRTGLLSAETRQLLQQHNYAALLEHSMLQLLNPMMPISDTMLKQDPLLLLPQFLLANAQGQDAEISLQHGWATRRQTQADGREHLSRLMVLQTRQSPYQIDYQQQSSAWLQQQQQQLLALGLKLSWTGTLAFASHGTQSAQQEISTIGVGSSIGLLLLVLFGFRSLRPLLTEFVAVSSGCLMALAVTHWLFAEIHLMTLVFGASLIGVCVDFSFYFMAMQSQYRDKEGFALLTPLLPSLFLGLLTTLIAYLFLAITPFPAFRQIAVFSSVGLLSAWISSILLLPRLPALNAQPALRRLNFLGQIRQRIVPYPKRRYAIILLVVLLSAVGLSRVHFNDDIHNLQSVEPSLAATDAHIRQRFAQGQGQGYFIVTGENAAQTERAESALLDQLYVLQQQGKLGQVQAAGQWFNRQRQQENIQLMAAIPASALRQYAEAMQLPLADIQHWQASLAQQTQLSAQQFKAHPFSQLILSDQARVVLIQGVSDGAALEAVRNSQWHLMQPAKQLSQLFASHRIHAQWLLLAAIISLAVLLGLLYGLSAVFPIMLPVSLALALGFAIQAFLGVQLNLFSIMGCFLILGIGVDYAIFYRHANQDSHVVAMALFLCMISTLLGFGLLAFSQTYAILCFGLTVLLGVILSFVFASCLTLSQSETVRALRAKTSIEKNQDNK